ncbi:hypothetical protein [Actinoplanes sp. GCM10030250]|uniref:hypothetical protein n=1 Tax=Actinoplanes sp. GCM10030250 TaxID=3273376 RepID=UPI003618B833
MDFDLGGAVSFVATHARVLDRRRLHYLLGEESPEAVAGALDAYRNADGGYGWALEPDLRSVTSQPVAAMHALEVFAEVGDVGGRAVRLADWLTACSLADGGVPFSLPFADTGGSAPHWTGADATVSSLQMTTQLAGHAHRAGLAGHPWLTGATEYCLTTLEAMTETPSAYELMFSMRFLDAVAGDDPRAAGLLDRFAGFVRLDGPTEVAGTDGEVLYPLDFTPERGAPSRAVFSGDAVEADLRRLAGQQQPDGGWAVNFPAYSAAAAVEWRGYATVQAVTVLRVPA